MKEKTAMELMLNQFAVSVVVDTLNIITGAIVETLEDKSVKPSDRLLIIAEKLNKSAEQLSNDLEKRRKEFESENK